MSESEESEQYQQPELAKNKSQTNLENFAPRERLADENDWQRYVYHQADTSGIPYLPTMLEYNWDEDFNDFAATTQVQVSVNIFQCTLPTHVVSKTILNLKT